jgi:hypothetical protein
MICCVHIQAYVLTYIHTYIHTYIMSFHPKTTIYSIMYSLLHVSVTNNHHQADISVHGHDMFSAYSMGCHIVYICCVEFQTFRIISCSIFSVLTNVFSGIIYEPINVSLSVKI